MPLYLPFLSSQPKVRITSELIEVGPSVTQMIRNLGIGDARLLVDSKARRLVVVRRSFWFFRSRRILAFDRIEHITHECETLGEGLGYVTGESGGHETFAIGVRLKSGEKVPLIELSGDAPEIQQTFTLPGERIRARVDEALDLAGTQQEDSLELVDLLQARIGVPLGH